ncbi:MerR family transcriptional regulator [Chungangia koreensis]|uniref:MerR family transcriptional regulator n=1 Tax=Chungangia koreensis TaxID=752657 RepID=A0ABV8WZI6_9LACT
MNKHEMYSISQVSEITGLSKQVIRKWEERYQLVQPERLENGRRIYNETDVQAFLKVRKLTESGYPVSQAAVIVHTKEPQEVTYSFKDPEISDYFLQLIEKGTHCDELELNRILKQAHHTLGLSNFLSDLILPFLKEVGDRWEKKEWTEYQESVSSMVVRDYLVQIRRNYPYREDAPLLMGACLPGELHEVQVQILLLQAMMKGWKSFLIGSSPAIGSIEALIEKFKPRIVLLSALTTIPFEQNPTVLDQLDHFAARNRSINFFLGGPGAIDYTKDNLPKHIEVVQTLEEVFAIRG